MDQFEGDEGPDAPMSEMMARAFAAALAPLPPRPEMPRIGIEELLGGIPVVQHEFVQALRRRLDSGYGYECIVALGAVLRFLPDTVRRRAAEFLASLDGEVVEDLFWSFHNQAHCLAERVDTLEAVWEQELLLHNVCVRREELECAAAALQSTAWSGDRPAELLEMVDEEFIRAFRDDLPFSTIDDPLLEREADLASCEGRDTPWWCR